MTQRRLALMLDEMGEAVLAKIAEQDPALIQELKAVDAALEGLGRSLAGRDDPEGRRGLALASPLRDRLEIALERLRVMR